jgi:hypothetical protein
MSQSGESQKKYGIDAKKSLCSGLMSVSTVIRGTGLQTFLFLGHTTPSRLYE